MVRLVTLALTGLAAAVAVRALSPADARDLAPGPSFAYLNGKWLTGDRFVSKPMYSSGGTFMERRPAAIDSTIDLGGGYVIPPFGDAHTHNLDGPFNLDSIRARYIREGTFFVQVMTNAAARTSDVRGRFNRPCDLDVAYANGGLTSTLSHPFLAYEPRAMTSIPPGADWTPYAAAIRKSRIRLGDAYWFIDSLPDLERSWPGILAARPDLIKIFLLDAVEVPGPMPETGLPSGRGLRPSLVAPIVRRAHAAGLRVAAHIETAADARIAIDAGVEMLAHLPGYLMSEQDDPTRYEIDTATARIAGERGVVVTPTLVWSRDPGGSTAPAAVEARIRLQARNIRRLRSAGAHIVIGSDRFGSTAAGEFQEFAALGLWSNVELVSLWSTETTRAIFPTRRLGRLEPGYEASFLVLAADPLTSLDALRQIRLRVKQGCVL
jgi:hypothetical protein